MKSLVSICTGMLIVLSILPLEGFGEEPKTEREKHRDNPRLPSGWRVHDFDRPIPPVVTPGPTAADAPSDAVILFDGSNLDEWVGCVSTNRKHKYNPDGEALWKVENGYMEITPTGDLMSRKEFGDCQIHLEWSAPVLPKGTSQGRGNSGIKIMGKYEIQVLDCFENTSYADGMAAAVYGQQPPLVNACREPGEWQTYDILFTAPRFDGDRLVTPAYVTVLHNGVVVQNHTPLLGETLFKKLPAYKTHAETGPIQLQDHNNPVRYRNIWVRKL